MSSIFDRRLCLENLRRDLDSLGKIKVSQTSSEFSYFLSFTPLKIILFPELHLYEEFSDLTYYSGFAPFMVLSQLKQNLQATLDQGSTDVPKAI